MSWRDWSTWEEMYRKWETAFGKENITLTYKSLQGVYDWFMRELERHPEVHIEDIDIEHTLAHDLTPENAKKILETQMVKALGDYEYEEMAKEIDSEMERQIRERYPGFLEEYTERVEKEVKKEKGKERLKKIRELEVKLAETERRYEAEKKAREVLIHPIKVRFLRDLDVGIEHYKVGSVVELSDRDWALGFLIREGYAEEVPLELPVYVPLPPPKPPEVKPPKVLPPKVLPPVPEVCPIDKTPLEQVERVPMLIRDPLLLTAEEEYWRARMGLPLPTRVVEWINVPVTMKVWMCREPEPHYFERDETGRLVQRTPEFLYRKILREGARLERVVAPPPILPAEIVLPPYRPERAILPDFWVWLRENKGLTIHDWVKKSESEQKTVLAEFEAWAKRIINEMRERGLLS